LTSKLQAQNAHVSTAYLSGIVSVIRNNRYKNFFSFSSYLWRLWYLQTSLATKKLKKVVGVHREGKSAIRSSPTHYPSSGCFPVIQKVVLKLNLKSKYA